MGRQHEQTGVENRPPRIADEGFEEVFVLLGRRDVYKRQILNLIKEKRPRFVPAFELMTFRDNTISVSVPTTELREEILRSKTGMLMRIAELAGIEGMIELEVIVNEEIRAVRPKMCIRDRCGFTKSSAANTRGASRTSTRARSCGNSSAGS